MPQIRNIAITEGTTTTTTITRTEALKEYLNRGLTNLIKDDVKLMGFKVTVPSTVHSSALFQVQR